MKKEDLENLSLKELLDLYLEFQQFLTKLALEIDNTTKEEA